MAIDYPLDTESRNVTYHRFPLPELIKLPSRSFRFLGSFPCLEEECRVSDPALTTYNSLLAGILIAPPEFYLKVI